MLSTPARSTRKAGKTGGFDIVHVGCPHASFEEMKHYATLLENKRVRDGVEFWITTSRAVRGMAEEAGLYTQKAGTVGPNTPCLT